GAVRRSDRRGAATRRRGDRAAHRGEVSRVALDPVLGAAATRQGFGACLMGRFSPCLGSVQPDARGTTRDAERAAPGRLSAMTARGSGARTAIGPVWRSDSGAQV